jgi:hypothetical protein
LVEHWFAQGLEKEVDAESAMLILSASMSYDHLVGHTGDACKKVDCKGGLTCDEKMTLDTPAYGHLHALDSLIRDGRFENGASGICWHMGSAILHVSQVVRGFCHPAFRKQPPKSIWTLHYRDYWQERLLGKWRAHREVWGGFERRLMAALREIESEVVRDWRKKVWPDMKSGGAGVESWSDGESEDAGLEDQAL